jgi:hypothetical protein
MMPGSEHIIKLACTETMCTRVVASGLKVGKNVGSERKREKTTEH